MVNGKQAAERNLAAFVSWSTSKTDENFREYVHRGVLKRAEIATECGFGKSALIQNPAIKTALEVLENGLRARGVLPALIEPLNEVMPIVHNMEAKQRQRDGYRLNSLEQENAALRAELGAVKLVLEHFKLLSQFLEETGRLPR
jgi:hypothetical protein